MDRYSIIIPHVARNNDLLRRNLPYVRKNLDCDEVCIVAAATTINGLRGQGFEGVKFINEDEVLEGLSLEGVKEKVERMGVPATRAGWYFQQFVKMAWALREDCGTRYLVWDSDTFPLKPVRFQDADGKIVFLTTDQYHPVYFDTLKALVGINRQIDRSFIAESMLFERDVMRELIGKITDPKNVGRNLFHKVVLDAVANSSNPYTAFSEFETYGNFVVSLAKNRYVLKKSEGYRNAAKYFGLNPTVFDLYRLSKKHDIASFEKWNTMIFPFIAMQKVVSVILFFLERIWFRHADSERWVR